MQFYQKSPVYFTKETSKKYFVSTPFNNPSILYYKAFFNFYPHKLLPTKTYNIIFLYQTGYYYQAAPNTFMFSLRNKANLPPFRSELLNKSGFATRQYPTYGPTFGRGDDLYINANRNGNSYTNFGRTFQTPPGYHADQLKTRQLLAGSYYFTPTEVEVYYLH